MVQISPLLLALAVLSQFTPSFSTSNGLVARQSEISPSSLPSSCQSTCQVLNTMNGCLGNLTCLCPSNVGTELQQCMDCAVSADPSASSDGQSALSAWNMVCGGNLSLSASGSAGGSSPSSTASSSSGSNGSVGLKAGGTAACIVATLAGAFISL